MRLADSTVLVTGAGSGIGRAIAQRCAKEGATVIVTDIAESGRETATALQDDGNEAHFYSLNVTDYERFEAVIEAIEMHHGGLDGLVNNAGITQVSEFRETTLEERDRLLAVNLLGTWNGCHTSIKQLVDKNGAIVNISSVGALHGFPTAVTYSLTKAGVLNLTQSLAAAYGGDGVRVNAVLPGRIETPLLRRHLLESKADRVLLESRHALERFGKPREVAACVAFLLSDDASFVTGHGLVVDGGSILRT